MSTGLQPERTGLAWQRTALAAGICSLLLLRHAAITGWGVFTIPAALAATAALTLMVAGTVRERQLQDARPPASAVLLGTVAVLSTATAVTAFATLMR